MTFQRYLAVAMLSFSVPALASDDNLSVFASKAMDHPLMYLIIGVGLLAVAGIPRLWKYRRTRPTAKSVLSPATGTGRPI